MPDTDSNGKKVKEHGGCLCGNIRYSVNHAPYGINICSCHFCQKMTGSDYMVEPVFRLNEFTLEQGEPGTYEHVSEGSGHIVTVHFCTNCGTTLFHLFERFKDCVGIFSGTFNSPAWFNRNPDTVDFVFLESATHGTIVPPGYRTFSGHLISLEGELLEPKILDHYTMVGEADDGTPTYNKD